MLSLHAEVKNGKITVGSDDMKVRDIRFDEVSQLSTLIGKVVGERSPLNEEGALTLFKTVYASMILGYMDAHTLEVDEEMDMRSTKAAEDIAGATTIGRLYNTGLHNYNLTPEEAREAAAFFTDDDGMNPDRG